MEVAVSQYDVYRSVFRDRFGIKSWIPAWAPGADLRPGMTGRMVAGEFVYQYDLKHRGVNVPDELPPSGKCTDHQWSTENAVNISVKASGQTDAAFQSLAAADLGFRLSFTDSDAMAIVYRNVTERHLIDQRALADEMVKSWQGGPWPKMQLGDIAITSLLVADWGFAFGASESGAEVVLRASADVGPANASLGSITGKIGVAWQRSTSVSALSPDGLVVGFRGLELRQRGLFVKKTVAEPKFEGAAEPETTEEPLVPADESWPV